MNGTDQMRPRCVALTGVVGEKTGCEIYEKRPSPCRDFKASYEEGFKSEGCDQARAGKNLLPLTRLSWK
jgi:Fe-S-cluster containining protein